MAIGIALVNVFVLNVVYDMQMYNLVHANGNFSPLRVVQVLIKSHNSVANSEF